MNTVVDACSLSENFPLCSFFSIVVLPLTDFSSCSFDTEMRSGSRSIIRMGLFPKSEISNTKSPNMGRLFLLLMTLDSADSLLESAVLDTENLIKCY